VDFHTGKRNLCGPTVRKLRSQKGWSQPELAAKCQLAGWDVSRDIIARIECQTRWVGDFELKELAAVLGVTPNDLLS
jgi:transcriptional regulator with XRE-family HTH domain